ncbi:MAG: DegT/DnrJ/EryC1/StrS aminotransferase family protein [Lentisphaerae bacterium]|nr:DegT/DnrJ/EryC1/StrS aminotransferase family protein [Lentisphaerota bacterium]MCP4100088.1 DegT/DnrJ/EryC1/StrS aminotransferase family protein [Lentisphaerota bacterium]
MSFSLPLMADNVTREDLDTLIEFLKGMPRLTQSENVKAFEEEWSEWLGVKYSLYVNSGASANLMTMAALKYLYGEGEVIVPPLTWVSDISSVLWCGFKPIFADINPHHLGMDDEKIIDKFTDKTKAVFLTYVQGFNCLTDRLLGECEKRGILLIEDVCESHGASFKGQRLGSFGLASNFSFYFAHHMSTIEGGMICTSDENFYQVLRMLRSHGMTREMTNDAMKEQYYKDNPMLSPDFIFAYPAFNCRGTEIGGVLGRSQIKRLDSNNQKRYYNFKFFLDNLDSEKYYTEFDIEGSVNYALALVIRKSDLEFRERLENTMRENNIEFRRGSSGGGNQLRQPYLKDIVASDEWEKYPEVEHIHSYGYYIGNYPTLEQEKIKELCEILNSVN